MPRDPPAPGRRQRVPEGVAFSMSCNRIHIIFGADGGFSLAPDKTLLAWKRIPGNMTNVAGIFAAGCEMRCRTGVPKT